MKRAIFTLTYYELDLLDLALDDLEKEVTGYLREAEEAGYVEETAKLCAALDYIDKLQKKIRRKKDKYENHE